MNFVVILRMFGVLALVGTSAAHAKPPSTPTVAGPWVHLRKSPLFAAQTHRLAPTWGSSIPAGTEFVIEKAFGRWLYGRPLPPRQMKAKDYPPSGWIYSRMLLPPGDSSTLSKAQFEASQLSIYYSHLLKLNVSPTMDFLESIVLSRRTLAVFRNHDEQAKWNLPSLFPSAWAESKKEIELGLSGTDLDFLQEEIKVAQKEKQKAAVIRQSKILKIPVVKPLTDNIREVILGRYLASENLRLPPLIHEEIDAAVYLRAVTQRTIEGCPKEILSHWENKRWVIFRILGLKSEEPKDRSWQQLEMPGGTFATSAKAIDVAESEAELAYLLARPLVRSLSLPKLKITLDQKSWAKDLQDQSADLWQKIVRNQSLRDSTGIDAADELYVDKITMQCLARAGYNASAALSYLKRLSIAREEKWAKPFFEHFIGFDYRLQRVAELRNEGLADGSIKQGGVLNKKRFQAAAKLWNILPHD